MNIWKIFSSKGERELDIPNCWEMVTTEQYIQMVTDWDKKDLVKLFSIISGIEYKTLAKTYDPELEASLLTATKFVYEQEPSFKKVKPPTHLNIRGKMIKAPTDIGGLSIGQSIHVRRELDDAKLYDQLIPYTVAIYMQPEVDGIDFDFDRAMMLEQEIKKMPITETYPLGFFLLKPLMKSGRSIGSGWHKVKTRLLQAFTKNGQA
jgi:hypothetical protein